MDYLAHIINMVLIFTMLASSLNLILGYGGMATMCHAALFGIGGYASAILTMNLGCNFLVGTILAALLSGFIGVLLASPSLRIQDEYLILFTTAFQMVIWGLMVSEVWITNGETGLSAIPRASVFGIQFLKPISYIPLIAALAALFFLICWKVSHSPFGRVLRCIREDELSTRSIGKNVLRFKVLTFMVGGAIAGGAGSILAHYNAYINPVSFNLDASILMIAMVVLGGSTNMFGSVVGSLLLVGIPEMLRFVPGTATLIAPLRNAIFGSLLIFFILFRPQGLIPEHVGRLRVRRTPLPKLPEEEILTLSEQEGPAKSQGVSEPVIEVKGIRKSFGGIQAVNSFSMSLSPGKITTLIGPNGCGKTTVFNLISGFISPDEGSIYLRGKDVTNRQPHELVQLGLVRSWQDVRIFRNMSVLDNVMAAIPDQIGERLFAIFFRPRRVRQEEWKNTRMALAYLEFVGLAEKAYELAGELSFAEQKQLSLARLIATGGSILLFDEPASGMDVVSTKNIQKMILRLAGFGKTICVVEHNLDLVKELSDESLFMNQGDVIRKAKPEELMTDPQLALVYFGG